MKQIREMLLSLIPAIQLLREDALHASQLAVVQDCQHALHKVDELLRTPQGTWISIPRDFFDTLLGLAQYHETINSVLNALAPYIPSSWGDSQERLFQSLARRLVSMRLFLDGDSSAGGFGNINATQSGDISVGLGLKLSDGSLQKFLSELLQTTGAKAEEFFAPFFDEDTSDLLNAIAGGQSALADFLRSQLILRFDPALMQKRFDLPQIWRGKFQRLSAAPIAQDAQISALAGAQFERTRHKALLSGIRSLRSFAMLFDLDEKTPAQLIATIPPRIDEQQKMLSLTDSVLSRMHGKVAAHWQSRMQSLFEGYGSVEGRLYDESRFLGSRADLRAWENPGIETNDLQLSPTAKPGSDYVVKPGDKLSTLVREAYQGHGDYRAVLRQNPQIDIHAGLVPGCIIHFPDKPPPAQLLSTPNPQLQVDESGIITFFDRTIGPLNFPPEQCELLAKKLSTLPLHTLSGAIAVRLQDSMAILCANEPLLIIDLQTHTVDETTNNHQNRSFASLKHIAAQIRGDLCLFERIYLPLASIPSEPYRKHWLKNTLERALAHPQFSSLRLIMQTHANAVDIMDNLDQELVRLEAADFLAIKSQPHRRLGDINADPHTTAALFASLWASDLLESGCELLVAPLPHITQLATSRAKTETLYQISMGTPVYATMRGTIANCGHLEDLGLCILIRHTHHLYSRYTHLATISVQLGQNIEADQIIGRTGANTEALQPTLGFSLQLRPNDEATWFCTHFSSLQPEKMLNSLWPPNPRLELLVPPIQLHSEEP